MMPLLSFLSAQPLLLHALALLLGLLVGSFLNVVIHRLPEMMQREWRAQCREILALQQETAAEKPPYNLLTPPSSCPHCGQRIAWWQNIPLLSYLLLRGRCHRCQKPISLRYPLVELSSGLLSLTVVWQLGATPQALGLLLLTWALIALTCIDLDHQLLPDAITLPMLWLGLLLSLDGIYLNPPQAIVGAAVGYLSLWSVFWLFKLATGKEGMGYGDFKLLALLGAWGGWSKVLLILLLSSLVGAVVGIGLILLMGHERNKPIPFGPYLAIAGWITLLWGDGIVQHYFRYSGLMG